MLEKPWKPSQGVLKLEICWEELNLTPQRADHNPHNLKNQKGPRAQDALPLV